MGKITEHQHQANLIKWFDLWAPNQYKEKLFAIPNGGQRHPAVAKKLKAEGVRSGVPDLMLPIPSGSFHGLFIELKAEGGRATESQKKWCLFLGESGYFCKICHGFDEARSTIEMYLNEPNRIL